MDRRRQRTDRTDRSDIENRARALADHLFIKRLGNGEQAVDVSVDHPIPGFIRRCREIVGLIYGGIIYQDIDSAPLTKDLAGHMLHSEPVSDRNLERQSPAAESCDLAFYLFSQIIT